MPRPKMKDGKPELDAEGKQIMEETEQEIIARLTKAVEDSNKAGETRDAEFKRLQALNKQLVERVSGMDVRGTVPAGAGGEADFSQLDFVNDPNAAVKAVVQAVVSNVQRTMQVSETARTRQEQLRAKFYKDNPDLVGFEDIVAVQAHKVDSEGTFNGDVEGAFAEAAKRSRAWLKEKGFAPKDGGNQPPVILPGSGDPKDKPAPASKGTETYDEGKEQADALADEIKSRGEAAGKRTAR